MPIRKSIVGGKPSLHKIAQMPLTVGRAALAEHYGVKPPLTEEGRDLIEELDRTIREHVKLTDDDNLPDPFVRMLNRLDEIIKDFDNVVYMLGGEDMI